MATTQDFLTAVQQGYTFKGESFRIGVAMLDKQVVKTADVLLPLKTMNRHGLIAWLRPQPTLIDSSFWTKLQRRYQVY